MLEDAVLPPFTSPIKISWEFSAFAMVDTTALLSIPSFN